MAFDMGNLGQQMDAISEEQLIPVIQMMRANRGMIGPMVRLFAKKEGVEEWADLILSDDVSVEELAQLFRIAQREKSNGAEAVRSALLSDPITGPLLAKASVRSGR